MSRLNLDCFEKILEHISDKLEDSSLLYTCTLLNSQCGYAATRHLYKDPWKHWLYRSKDEGVAKKLINTYMLCHNSNEFKSRNAPSKEGEREENPSKRIATEDKVRNRMNDEHLQLPKYQYISFAKNLHVPSLYQCVKFWYIRNHDEEDIQSIYDLFLKIFELFVEEAKIEYCTFAESTEDCNFPIRFDELDRLINYGVKVDLKYLNLGFFKCSSDDISRITGRCNNLKTFKISAQNCSDEKLANFIRSLTCLTKLKIRNSEKIDLTLEALETQSESLVKLRILSSELESCQKPFDGIGSCLNLRSIYMRKINWPSLPIVSISALLMPIAKNCEFHNIDFSNTDLPVDVLIEIAKKSSTTLRKVHLVRPENKIIDLSAGIRALADYSKNISHFERDIMPEEINSMIYFLDTIGNSLVRLEIESNLMRSFDASDLIISIGSNCPNLETLNINYFRFTPHAFERLIQGCKSLSDLSICDSMSVTDQILNIIKEKGGGKLKSLDILACSQITEEAVGELQAVTDIEIDY